MDETTYINELLTYATYYIHNSCVNNIKKMISSFYGLEEIIASKKMLWSLCSDSLESYTERKTSDKRSSADAHINDIFDALLKLDIISKVPSFVAKNIDKLPDRQPEELNMISIINRLAKLEQKQIDSEEMLQNHETKIEDLKKIDMNKDYTQNINNKIIHIEEKLHNFERETKELENLMKKQQYKINEARTNICFNKNFEVENRTGVGQKNYTIEENDEINSPVNDEKYNEVFEKFLDACIEGDKKSMSISEYVTNNNSNERHNSDTNDQTTSLNFDPITNLYSNVVKKPIEVQEDNMKEQRSQMQSIIIENDISNKKNDYFIEDEDGFVRKIRRSPYKKNEGDHLIGAPNLCTVWINKVIQGNIHTIKKYLNDRKIRVNNITKTSHNDSQYKSFKMFILNSDREVVLGRNFWPDGVKCRIWRDKNGMYVRSRTFSYRTKRGKF